MSDTDNSGPAFPPAIVQHEYGTVQGPAGMSLRDWFAGQALVGFTAHPDCGSVGEGFEETTECCVREAYALADAMLKARKP